MFEFFLSILTSMDLVEFFYYPAVSALICAFVALFLSFDRKGVPRL